VGEDEPLHAAPPRLARDVESRGVTALSATESNRTRPARGLREHEIRARGPGGEAPELGRPYRDAPSGADAVPKRRMVRVHDGARLDLEVLAPKRGDFGNEA
jgi:hypothetical protein